MRRNYYLLWLRVEATETYLIWSSAEEEGDESIFLNDTGEDRLLLDDTGYLKTFPSIEIANEFSVPAGLRLAKERPALHDLDHVESVMEHGAKSVADYNDCLSAWDLYLDLAKSVSPPDAAFLATAAKHFEVYDKLFRSAGVLPDEETSVSWDRRDMVGLHAVLSSGRAALSKHLPSPFR